MRLRLDRRRLAAVAVALAACAVAGLGRAPEGDPLSRWRPGLDVSGVRYVGSEACARCHTRQAANFFSTPMARAAAPPAESRVLARHDRLSFRNGAYVYGVARENGRTVYTVGDGAATISEPVFYCFGEGVSGQTFVVRHDGEFYESRVSFFEGLGGLDVTILHPRA